MSGTERRSIDDILADEGLRNDNRHVQVCGGLVARGGFGERLCSHVAAGWLMQTRGAAAKGLSTLGCWLGLGFCPSGRCETQGRRMPGLGWVQEVSQEGCNRGHGAWAAIGSTGVRVWGLGR